MERLKLTPSQKGLVGVIGLLVVYAVVMLGVQARTFYKDYQDFKVMRAWVIQQRVREIQQQKANQAAPVVTPAPAPKG